jgi:signal transduction histidine kinase
MSGSTRGADEVRLRILLLEDSDLDAELVTATLAEAGISHVVDRVMDRDSFTAAARQGQHDLILADYVLPTFDGLSALAIARELCPDTPFVFVSGTLGEDVAVDALKTGATDYATKQRLDRLPRIVVRALSEAEDRRARREAELALRELNATLERRVAERTAALTQEIAEREKAEGALRQAQRLEAVGQLTSGVAHDFNNLLTVILGNLRYLERSLTGDEHGRRLAMMRTAAERGAKLTGQLLAFSRRQRLAPSIIDLNETVRSMRDLIASTMGGTILIKIDLEPDLWRAMVDPTQIELVILNLAINARDAMPAGGTLTVSTANVRWDRPEGPEEPSRGEFVCVTVADSGHGMSPEVRARVFEPFFTTKGPSKGSGLGLAQVYGFAKQSGGGVRIETTPERGTAVAVYLPRASEDALDAEPPAQGGAVVRAEGRQIVLVVDDDRAVREVTTGTLADLGYRVIEAGSGREALQRLAQMDGAVDLMLVDFAMPEMNGVEVARRARALRPDLPVIFVTGYAAADAIAGIDEEDTIQKPYDDGELGRKIAAVFAR